MNVAITDTVCHPIPEVLVNDAPWYAIHTRARHEKKVVERLANVSCETFVPLYRRNQRWKNGVRIAIDFPLFPGYVFARLALSQRYRALQVAGVVALAGPPTNPSPIAGDVIDALRLATSTRNPQPHPFVNLGIRVRIVTGPLTGLEGILVRRANDLRVVLSVESIMRSFTVEVNELDIEPVFRPRPF